MILPFEQVSQLRLGTVVEVSGTTIKVELSNNVAELSRTYDGRVYPIGQIGSVVKVHIGRRLVFGFVTLLRMRSEEVIDNEPRVPIDADQRLMEVELFAEGAWNSNSQRLAFKRGVSTYPLPRQGVYLMTQVESDNLYQTAEEGEAGDIAKLVPIGSYVGTDGTICNANMDKMLGLHCAVLGSTGTGKSGAVAALLHSILEHQPVPQTMCTPRIIIIDPHGEYGSAFPDSARVYRAYDPIGTEESVGDPIQLPYWLMSADEFRLLVIGKTEDEATSQHNIVYKALQFARLVYAGVAQKPPSSYGWDIPTDGYTLDAPRPVAGKTDRDIAQFDRDKPRPFSLNIFYNHIMFLQAARPDKHGKTEQVNASDFSGKFKSILDKLSVLRLDARLKFMMQDVEEYSPTLVPIIAQLVGRDRDPKRNLRVVNISGLPNEVAGPLSAMIARLLFQYKLYQSSKDRERDPVLLVCEEAHRYVPNRGDAEYSAAQSAIRRIAREGRKYGISLMLVSQRPSDVESTVISQCGTWVILRLTNSSDQSHVSRFLPDGLVGMTRMLPSLGQQEALFVGEGAALPTRIRIRDLRRDQLPQSQNISFAAGWSAPHLTPAEIEAITNRMVQ